MFTDRRDPASMEVDGIFGTITCPECHTVWSKEFVPELCTKCGLRVAAAPGEGLRSHVERIERFGIPIEIIVCPRCGERYPDVSPALKQCLRCWTDLPRGLTAADASAHAGTGR